MHSSRAQLKLPEVAQSLACNQKLCWRMTAAFIHGYEHSWDSSSATHLEEFGEDLLGNLSWDGALFYQLDHFCQIFSRKLKGVHLAPGILEEHSQSQHLVKIKQRPAEACDAWIVQNVVMQAWLDPCFLNDGSNDLTSPSIDICKESNEKRRMWVPKMAMTTILDPRSM